ncbi:4Fe-4S dicluster domain-containing protein [Methanomassiliicoccus luminyensis]|uniref:4Fe-4S dicluster domain-containing protein n=1 Tax=Methanomassiliicoccus luminyensis TaxID=1080712 RepID=UPI00037C893B|nr:4Fe-4S dicluster domain-containing protein [Methanomassiliicoccus luminyensis]
MRRTAEDPSVARDLNRGSELHRCQQCGACASVCPSQARGGIRPAELMARASLGAVDVRSERSVWLCAACMSCSERCPSGAGPGEVVARLRELASEAGNRPPYLGEEAKRFMQTGICFPKTGMTRKMRKELGLDDMEVSAEAVREVGEICRRTGLGRLRE